jgi:hypothetical protein
MVLEVKDLAGFINPSLPLPGNILNRVVLYRVGHRIRAREKPIKPLELHSLHVRLQTSAVNFPISLHSEP